MTQHVEPCPFCGAIMQKDGPHWIHPGVVTDDDCLMSGKGIHTINLSSWNRRTPSDDVGRLRAALEASRQGWENAVEFCLLPAQHRDTARNLSEQCAKAIAALSPAMPTGGWQPMESAPKDGTWVLVYAPDLEIGVTMASYYREEERDPETGRFAGGEWAGAEWDGVVTGYLRPTHWQPLPPSPAKEPQP